ncbi:lysozyme inhibitor LprI family protein [Methylotuvimicrobium sp. KM1]|uniref:lysozyme inhibitor LprI family protein n=1 Tax=Methylotuvimicrobium sp. KM1 TaxID=3377707 RepID=UPI00384D1A2F
MNLQITSQTYRASAFWLLILSHSAFAADVELNPEFSSCMDQSGGVTVNMIDCIGQEHERQDDRLNGVYKTLMDTLPEERKSALRDAQRAWLKYREANCHFYNDPDGGTMARVQANDCFMTETAKRAKELEAIRSMTEPL